MNRAITSSTVFIKLFISRAAASSVQQPHCAFAETRGPLQTGDCMLACTKSTSALEIMRGGPITTGSHNIRMKEPFNDESRMLLQRHGQPVPLT